LQSVSRDHKRFIIGETLSEANGNLYLVERAAPTKSALLTPHSGDVLYGAFDLTRDGKTLYFGSNEGREFSAMYTLDLATHTSIQVAQPEWDVEGAGFTHAWKYFFTVTNNDGQTELDVQDAMTHKPVTLPAPPPGGTWVPLGSSRTDRYLGVRFQGDTAPA